MESADLTQAEFGAHVAAGTLRIALVGMSNVGKSYRSKVLRDECGFVWYDVDGAVMESLGFDTIEAISKWLGYPSSAGYGEREREYLASEDTHTKVDFLDTGGKNLVFDTTGSVIYLSEPTLAWLKDNCLIVNLVVEEGKVDAMIQKFFDHPKPVIWNNFFGPLEGETEDQTLRRCYPTLLADRLIKYRALAHINIPAEKLRDKSGQETIDIIKSQLPV